jgi:hypothetical protein
MTNDHTKDVSALYLFLYSYFNNYIISNSHFMLENFSTLFSWYAKLPLFLASSSGYLARDYLLILHNI